MFNASMTRFGVALQSKLAAVKADDRGATAVEYGLMVALIAIVIIVGVTAVGVNLLALFNQIAGELV